jgi:hypothetical protein
MKIMHLIIGVCGGRDFQVETIDAREKFRQLGVQYTTQNKAHKQLSVDLALNWLTESGIEDVSPRPLTDYDKKDDISDAINQLRGWLITH